MGCLVWCGCCLCRPGQEPDAGRDESDLYCPRVIYKNNAAKHVSLTVGDAQYAAACSATRPLEITCLKCCACLTSQILFAIPSLLLLEWSAAFRVAQTVQLPLATEETLFFTLQVSNACHLKGYRVKKNSRENGNAMKAIIVTYLDEVAMVAPPHLGRGSLIHASEHISFFLSF